MDKCLLTKVVFIDLPKTFDTVSHSNLLNKLLGYSVKSTELKWFTIGCCTGIVGPHVRFLPGT
jgi:hypothetical protein